MRILSVQFQNLNSLKGKHAIRFDDPCFEQNGIFAITGPTGAGKTTILDAITVALYGHVARHDFQKADKLADKIMTRHTSECFSEIEFEVGEKVYRARWQAHRTRGRADGNIHVAMSLIDLQTSLAVDDTHTASKVKEKIEELTGLDYMRFTRSVLLSQGDFAAFLKAKDSERGDLLERITGTEIYSEISKAAYEKHKEERDILDKIKNNIGNYQVLNDEERVAKIDLLHEKKQQAMQVEQQTEALRGYVEQYRQLAQIRQKYSELREENEAVEQKKQQAQPQFDRLQIHQNVLPLRAKRDYINGLLGEVASLEKKKQQIEADKKELTIKEQEAFKLKEEAENDHKKAQEALKNAEPLLGKAFELLGQLKETEIQAADRQKELEQAKKEFDETAKIYKQKESEWQKKQQALAETEQWLSNNQHAAELEAQLPLIKDRIDRYNTEKRIAEQLQLQQKEADKKLKNTEKKAEEQQKKWDLQTAACHEIEKKVTEMSQQQPLSDKDEEAIAQKNQTLQMLIPNLKQWISWAEAYMAKKQELVKSGEQHRQDTKELAEKEIFLQEQNSQYAQAKEKLALFEKLHEQEQLIAKYEKDRQLLRPNMPCMLCGSEHHPYIEGKYVTNESETSRQLAAQKLACDVLQREISNLEKEISALTARINERIEQGRKVKKETENILAQYQEAQVQQNIAVKTDIENPSELKNYWQQCQQESAKNEHLLGQQKAWKKQFEAQKEAQNQCQKSLPTVQESYWTAQNEYQQHKDAAERLQNEVEQKNTQLTQQSTELLGLCQKYVDNSFISVDKLPFIVENLKKQAETYRQKHAFCQQNREEKGKLEVEKEQLAEKGTESRSKVNIAQTNFDKSLQQKQQLSGQLAEVTRNFKHKDPKIERQYLQQELEKTDSNKQALANVHQELKLCRNGLEVKRQETDRILDIKNNAYNDAMDEIKPLLTENGFASMLALNEAFLTDEEAQKIMTLQRDYNEQLAALQKALKDKNAEIADLETKLQDMATEPEIEAQVKLLVGEKSILEQSIGSLNEQLIKDDEQRANLGDLKKQIDAQEKIYNRWHRLYDVIGSKEGDKFSRFAQSLTLARLVALANRHLNMLNDRYLLQQCNHADGKNMLDLEIVDTYQADAVRPIKSLSGGETFLVSLALALGLSDLASKQTQIRSLFIDEGFGTLDSDTLDMAIYTLENLQANGKTVGIISHVEALKDRILTQIQVYKISGGVSGLTVKTLNMV